MLLIPADHDNQNRQFPRLVLSILVIALTWQQAVAQTTGNLISNPEFDRDLNGWETSGPAEFAIDPAEKHSGKGSARITVTADQPLKYQHIAWPSAVKPGQEYVATFWVRCKDLKAGAGAYGCLEFWQDNKRLSFVMSFPTRAETWHKIGIEATVPKNANRMRFVLLCHARGSSWFDDIRLTRTPPQPLEVNLVLQPDKIITDNWQGFGCQGDLFLNRRQNIVEGITDQDRRLIRQRILTMRPQIVRLLFNLRSWEPTKGVHTPDSEFMKDLRATLAIYKEVGADIHLTEWGSGLPVWCKPSNRIPHKDYIRAFTDSFVSAVKYLRQQCGFKNIRYLTLYNEPNWPKLPWENYVAIYRSLHESLKTAGIRREVAILGPDEANTFEWLANAIRDLDDVIDYYDVHNYTCDTGSQFGRWVVPRIMIMPKLKSGPMSPLRKRLLITEFGMHDSMETYASPHIGEYKYGIFLADSAIEAAREGVSAMLMWCLMDTNYANKMRMKWGLWRFRDQNWEPRPGFYAWSLLTRYTKRGSTVHPLNCNVSDASSVAFRAPATTNAAILSSSPSVNEGHGRWSLLAVNRRKTERPLTITGLPPKSKWQSFTYSGKTIPTLNKDMLQPSQVVRADGQGQLVGTLPEHSFVLWRQVQP
ncbi:MAG: carbohydrate binding domain-containing protein [Planctomycetota bacterium]|jgi:alpha-galactosidase